MEPIIFNLQINAMAIVVVMLILYSNRRSHIYLPESKAFRQLLLHLLVLLALDSAMWMVDSRGFPGARALNLAVNYAYYAEQALVGYLWGVYSHRLTRTAFTRVAKWIHRIPLVLALGLLLANPLTQSVFTVSADNVYARGWGVWGTVYAACVFLYVLEAMARAICRLLYGSAEGRQDNWNLLFSSALPIFGVVLQMLVYGVATIWSFGALGLLVLYFNVQARHAAQGERELTDSRITVMLSQIQPHFLYNALASIQELIQIEPAKADQAIAEFSDYLRGNLDSLSVATLISFEKELNHTRHYLYLEQVRFEERLKIRYEIETTHFRLPTLTLQPVVENAVRYGVTKRPEGGTLTIATSETADAYLITVTDDGVGFDTDSPPGGGRSHTGIRNVRYRLHAQCRGELTIKSTPGVGTAAVIRIPKDTPRN